MSDHILIIDGLNYIYRANITFGAKIPDDKPSFIVVYNFFRNLRATIERFAPTKVFFCLEGANVFRYGLYPEYKANRIIKTGSSDKQEKKDDFNRQRDIIIDLLSYLPITTVKTDGFEADDVAATLIDNMRDENITVITNDNDYIQLLQKGYKGLKIFNPSKKDYAVSPDYFHLTHKVLTGDKSDNISRIVSDKVATILSTDPEKLKTFLSSSEENRANYALNLSLIELKVIDFEKLQFVSGTTDYGRLRAAFADMEFQSMMEDKYWEKFVATFQTLEPTPG